MKKAIVIGGVLAACTASADRWFDSYVSVLANPQKADYAAVAPDVVRSAGYYGGWYGYWYHDDQIRTGYAPNMWNNVGKAGSRRFFYFDSGEVGDYCAFFDSAGDLVKNAWQIANWTGTPAIETARWMGLEGFMTNAAWAPYDTAADYGLPAFTHPDGSAITSNLYSVLSRKKIDGDIKYKQIVNRAVGDETATNSGLSEISRKINGAWNTVTLYHVDNANPQLAAYRVAEAQKLMSDLLPDGIHIDNMGANNLWWPRESAFGDWSVYRFRGYLTNRFSSAELTAHGVTSPETFSIRDYVNAGPDIDDDAWTEDTLWNEYKIFKAQAGIEYQQTLYSGLTNKAAQLGLDFAVTGNLLPVWPGAALNKGLFDIDNFEWRAETPYPEWSTMGLPPDGRSAGYVTRLGANMSTTPYCWINLYVETNNAAKPELHKVMACDTLANRGILDYAFEYEGKTFAGTDESAAFVNDWISVMAAHGLSGREYAADIGLLFNPWCDVAESTVHSMQHNRFIEEYSGWCDYLTETHRQWDVVLSTEMTADLLANYPILVLPSVTVLSDPEADLLKQYANSGGRLIITGQTGRRYGTGGSLLPRAVSTFDGFSAADFRSTTNYPGRDYRLNSRAAAAAAEMDALLSFSGFTPSLQLDSPIAAGVNLSRRTVGGATRLSIDINNYGGYVATNDTVIPAGSAWITVQLPDEMAGTGLSVSRIYAGMADPLSPQPLHASQVVHRSGELQIQVDPTRYYQTILIEEGTADPYAADSGTLHLWHLEETENPLRDDAGALDLFNWGGNGTLRADSFSGLNGAYESSTATNSVIQSNGSVSWTNELMGADGAFTWEMVLRPDEPADSGSGFRMLMQHAGNQMHLKLHYAAGGTINLSLYNNAQGTLVYERLDDPALGEDQYETNVWFHLAVAYDGSGTGTVYWTRLNEGEVRPARELLSFSMSDFALTDAVLAFGGNANLNGNVFRGALDEIRISRSARRADEFLTFSFAGFDGWIGGYALGTSTRATDNPDGDRFDNLTEFALGGDPSDALDAGRVPMFGNGPDYFEYVYARRRNADSLGLNYRLEWTDDLVGTPWTNAYIEVTGTNITGDAFDYVTNRISTEILPAQYLKLMIETD